MERSSSSLKTLQNDLRNGNRTITISGGLACMELLQERLEKNSIDAIATKLIEVADQKLYASKQSGRNRIMSINLSSKE